MTTMKIIGHYRITITVKLDGTIEITIEPV